MSIVGAIKNFFTSENKKTSNQKVFTSLSGNYFEESIANVLSPNEFFSIAYLTRGFQVIANTFSSIDFIYLKKGVAVNNSITMLLNKKPHPFLTPWEFKKIIAWDLLLYGNAVIYKHYELDKKGKKVLKELIPLYPDWVKKKFINNKLVYEVSINKDKKDKLNNWDFVPNADKILEIDEGNIIWIDYEIINGFSDVNIRSLFKSALTKAKENEINFVNTLRNDLNFSVIIKVPEILNKEQREQAELALNQMWQNQKKSKSVGLVVDNTWDIANNASNIQSKITIETRNALGQEVAAMLGIPASKLGVEEKNKYNTLTEKHKSFIDDSIKPLLYNVTQKLTQALVDDLINDEISFSPLDLLNLDPKALQEFGVSGINNAIFTPNEIRGLIGLNPIAEGDYLMANSAILPLYLNKQKAETLISQQEANIKQAKEPPQEPEKDVGNDEAEERKEDE